MQASWITIVSKTVEHPLGETMEFNERQSGTIHVLLERLANERLPRILEIKSRVDQGERLTDIDIEFLEQVLRDASENAHFYSGFPEYHDIAVRVVAIYHDVMGKALENEKNSKS